MTQRRHHLKSRFGTLFMIACLSATQAGAQAGGNDLPSAQEIWRHLPPLPGEARKPAPEPVPAAPSPRPAPPASAVPRPSAPAVATPRRAPAAAVQRSTPEATAPMTSRTLAQARVVIHHPEGGGYERAQELVRLLRAVGTAEVETRAVRYAVDRQSIRYFHAADRDVSGTIGELVAVAGEGGRETVADFTSFRPLPRNGTIEIWLPERRF